MNRFAELGIDEKTVKAITELGFENPTPIQEQAIPEILGGNRDLVALAQTGTGKTAAFGLPLTQLVDFTSKNTQALILCPTRELCMQISKDLKNFTKYISGANIVPIYGGASIETQTREVNRGAQIVVGTPGRMVDMIDRKRVNLKNVKFVVLDEADEMLNMGFQEDLTTILSETPKEKNTWLFSATMPSEVSRIAKKYMSNPFEITVGNKNQGAANIEHQYYVVQGREKYQALKRIADFNPDIFAIVFCRTRVETQEIADALIKDGYNADSLHGDLSQAQRDFVMKRYRSRSLQMLVATDVAARGIDVDDVTHVINYNLPDEIENYTHRSGRTARAGKSGVSIAIISSKDIGKIRAIERIIGRKFTLGTVPNGKAVCEKQLFHLVKKIHNVKVNEEEITEFLPKIYDELKDLSKEELIKRFISEEFNRFLAYYKNSSDLNAKGERGERSERRDDSKTERMFITLGEMDGFNSASLQDYVAEIVKVDKNNISRIEIKSSFSFFDIDRANSDLALAAFKDESYNDRRVKIEVSGGGKPRSSSGGSGGYRGGEKSYGGGGGGKSFSRGKGGYGSEKKYGGGEKKYGSRSDSSSGSGEKKYGRGESSGGSSSSGGDRRDKFKRPRISR